MLPPAFRPPDNDDLLPAWLDWLDAHRLTPAAARALAHAPLPESARSHLHASYARARGHWLLRKTTLQRFLTLVAREPAQPVILLKGAALALTLYDDPAIRPMSDIDLLIAPRHMSETLRRVRISYPEQGLAPGHDTGYLHHFIFTDPITHIRLELHKTIPLLPDETQLDWFLQQTTPRHLDNLPFLTLTPEAQLLHLVSHAILEHGGVQGALGIWLYDIDQLIRTWGDQMDWQQTIARAQTLQWEAALHEGIQLARQHFHTPIPAAIPPWLELPQTSLSGYNILRSMTAPSRNSSLTTLHILRGLSWRQRWQQIGHMLFPSRHYLQRRYPRIPWLLAYPWRWFDASRKLLIGLLRK